MHENRINNAKMCSDLGMIRYYYNITQRLGNLVSTILINLKRQTNIKYLAWNFQVIPRAFFCKNQVKRKTQMLIGLRIFKRLFFQLSFNPTYVSSFLNFPRILEVPWLLGRIFFVKPSFSNKWHLEKQIFYDNGLISLSQPQIRL